MNFPCAIHSGFSRMFDFRTRSARSEYWYWQLFVFLLMMVGSMILVSTAVIPSQIVFSPDQVQEILADIFAGVFGWSVLILFIVVTIATLALSVRRLHDLEWSGWWMLVYYLIPFTFIIFIIAFCFRGTQGNNRYGADPLS